MEKYRKLRKHTGILIHVFNGNVAQQNNIPLSVCGEMAGRSDSIMVLGGMGIRDLSMSPKLISSTKELLSRFTIQELEAISAKHLNKIE